MGMDYQYAGSASYPRFDAELGEVAKEFGGVFDPVPGHRGKYTFPDGTSEILIRWFNDPYAEDFTVEETKEVCMCVAKHPKIEDISYQIWFELEMCCALGDAWYIT